MKVTIDLYTNSPEDLAVLGAVIVAARARPPARSIEYSVPPVEAGRSDIAMRNQCQTPVEDLTGVTDYHTGVSSAVAPPPPPVEAAAVVPPPPPVDGCDSDGLPWDGRIHSSSKARLADGRWRQRRNTDPSIVTEVTAELRAALSAPPAPAAIVPPPPVSAVLPFPFPPIEEPAATSAPAAVPPPPAAMTFPEFMRAITAARLAPGVVLEACKAVGMPSIPALSQRPDLIPTVAAALEVS